VETGVGPEQQIYLFVTRVEGTELTGGSAARGEIITCSPLLKITQVRPVSARRPAHLDHPRSTEPRLLGANVTGRTPDALDLCRELPGTATSQPDRSEARHLPWTGALVPKIAPTNHALFLPW
jgi:hypothetical protein